MARPAGSLSQVTCEQMRDSIPVAAVFPRCARLRRPKQFQDTFSRGQRLNTAVFRLHVRFAPSTRAESGPVKSVPGEAIQATPVFDCAGTRLGIAVSKRVDPHAVGRNRIKRLCRESFRAICGALPPGDYVVLAQRDAARADNAQLTHALDTLWARVRSGAVADRVPLKRGIAAVTMPPRDLPVAAPGSAPELP